MTKLSLVTVLALTACGNKKEAPPTPSPSPTAPAATPVAGVEGTATGKCSFTTTGDVTLTVEGISRTNPPNGKAMASTDYWMTDAQLRAGLETLAGLDQKKSKDEIAAKVEEGMKKDPRVILLIINCGSDAGAIDLGPHNTSKYADVPMKPGKYAIASPAKAGEFNALINLRPPGGHDSFTVSEPGTLDITKFDLTGITGTFALKAKSLDGKKSIEVHGSFDYPCVGQACTKS